MLRWFGEKLAEISPKKKVANSPKLIIDNKRVEKAAKISRNPEIARKKPCNIIMSGGSLKGVAFIGCVRRMEEEGQLSDLKNLIGTSFGSLVLFMLAMGCTSEEMLSNVILGVETSKRQKLVGAFVNCVERGGIDDGTILLECVKRPLVQKLERSDVTFLEFVKLTGKNLIVVGSNLSSSNAEVFSVDTTPFMSVVLALRISASIPIVFEPVIHEGALYVDGALFDNFPVSLLAERGLRPEDTAGYLISSERQTIREFDNKSLIFLVETMCASILSKLNARNEKIEKRLATFVIIDQNGVEEMSNVGYSFEAIGFILARDDAEKIENYGYLVSSETSEGRNGEGRKDREGDGLSPPRIPTHEAPVVGDKGSCADAREPHDEKPDEIENLKVEVEVESEREEDVPRRDEVKEQEEEGHEHARVQE